jgi:hypothetical protein
MPIARHGEHHGEAEWGKKVDGDKHFAVAEDLRGFAPVIADIAALAHGRIDKKVPIGGDDLGGVVDPWRTNVR